jgi:hypothetical protein
MLDPFGYPKSIGAVNFCWFLTSHLSQPVATETPWAQVLLGCISHLSVFRVFHRTFNKWMLLLVDNICCLFLHIYILSTIYK